MVVVNNNKTELIDRLTLTDGTRVFYQLFQSKNIEKISKGLLVCVHGIGEHSNRHRYLIDLFNDQFDILFFDLRGHGKSEGIRGWIESFDQYQADVREIVEYVLNNKSLSSKDIYFFAHSMGALILCDFLKNQKQDLQKLNIKKIFLSAPPVALSGVLGTIVKKIFPSSLLMLSAACLPTIKINGSVDLNYLSHDPKVKEDYISDPLNILHLESRLLLELARKTKELFKQEIEIFDISACVVVGEDDRVVDPISVREHFLLKSKKFKFKMINGAYHEIHNEVHEIREPYFELLKLFMINNLN